MLINSYEDLVVWQKSMDLVEIIYKTVKLLPREEMYGLSNQMRRAAVSVPSNIAEGQQRKSTKEFINFLSIAKGSTAELHTQCLICVRLNYFRKEQIQDIFSLLSEIGKMLTRLIDKLESLN